MKVEIWNLSEECNKQTRKEEEQMWTLRELEERSSDRDCHRSFFPFLASADLAGAVQLSVLPSPPVAADFGRV